MKVCVKRLQFDAIIPEYHSSGAACFDLHAWLPFEGVGCVHPTTPLIVGTGLAFDIPDDHVMLIFSRSGHGFKNDIRLANCVGVIDSDYRGEVKVKLTNDNNDGSVFQVKRGDRIAQAMVIPVQRVSFEEVYELGVTYRGEAGFGSTGA